MNKLSGSVAPVEPDQIRDSHAEATLEFPIDPGFASVPPQIDPQVMLRRIAETMPWRSTRPGERDRRRDQGISVEFVL